jgi:hypothetical protein
VKNKHERLPILFNNAASLMATAAGRRFGGYYNSMRTADAVLGNNWKGQIQ